MKRNLAIVSAVLTVAEVLAFELSFGPKTPVAEISAAVRSAKETHPGEAICVKLREGVYELSSPWELLPEDSGSKDAPVSFVGQGKGAVFTGGRRIVGWQRKANGVWEAPLPLDENGKPEYFEMLYVNGRRAQRARWPKQGFFRPQETSIVFTTNQANKQVTEIARIAGTAEQMLPLAETPEEELPFAQLITHIKWISTRRPVAGYNAAKRTVSAEGRPQPAHTNNRKDELYYFENLRSAFDTQGEWFYDAANAKVCYIPLPYERMAKTLPVAFWQKTVRIEAPLAHLRNLLVVKGDPSKGKYVHDISFRNISFVCSDSPFDGKPANIPGGQAALGVTSAAILADGAQNLHFENCSIRNTGEYALWLRSGCTSNTVERCLLVDLGAGGVRIGDNKQPVPAPKGAVPFAEFGPTSTAFNTVDNCIIRHCGRYHAAGIGVLVTHSSDNRISHNEISDLYYTGISVGWVWGYRGSVAQRNTIEFNRIHAVGQGALADMGGIYTLGTSFGTVISNNLIYDVDSYSYGGWGLYPDEGSEGILLQNNLVFKTKDASFHQHYGRDNILRNNILACSKAGQIAVTRAEKHRSLVAERNLVFWTDGPTFQKYNGTLKETSIIDWRSNLWWKADGKFDFNGKTFAQWNAKGNDVGGLAEDPHFVNPVAGDFRLPPDSPALKIGFVPFDASLAGVYGSDEWKKMANE